MRWYFGAEGPGAEPAALPFYCDPARVGAFAVAPAALARGDEAALFRLFVTLSMYQALRDVIIMERQRALPAAAVARVADLRTLGRAIERHPCAAFRAPAFAAACDIAKDGARVDCATRPGAPCPVKDATVAFHRMADLGKLPASAWLALWRDGDGADGGGGAGLAGVLASVCRESPDPRTRAARMVARVSVVHRVGRKLASLYVSALSTPTLAPGLTPWFPALDGHDILVIDTNVARAVDRLRPPGAPRTYDAREQWLRAQAAQIDLRALRPDLPRTSPRLVQEALYAFCSRSNRSARGDRCAIAASSCERCDRRICPFV
ncbi:MAG TPA: hypothetical protein VHE35_14120 [Kofleriaceae bacterium]|nr:hypothetical protein [Kofleriaceae bacterium]